MAVAVEAQHVIETDTMFLQLKFKENLFTGTHISSFGSHSFICEHSRRKRLKNIL